MWILCGCRCLLFLLLSPPAGSGNAAHTHILIHTHAHTQIHTYTYAHTYTHIHAHAHARTHINTHIHIHAHAHTNTPTLQAVVLAGFPPEEHGMVRNSVCVHVRVWVYVKFGLQRPPAWHGCSTHRSQNKSIKRIDSCTNKLKPRGLFENHEKMCQAYECECMYAHGQPRTKTSYTGSEVAPWVIS